jgi:hypothetical protein
MRLPRSDYGVELNFVGVQPDKKARASVSGKGRWVEPLDPGRLHPANLHEAQRKRRLKAE